DGDLVPVGEKMLRAGRLAVDPYPRAFQYGVKPAPMAGAGYVQPVRDRAGGQAVSSRTRPPPGPRGKKEDGRPPPGPPPPPPGSPGASGAGAREAAGFMALVPRRTPPGVGGCRPMTALLLPRHAQSVWNEPGRWQGWAAPPLSALGEAQVQQAADRLSGEPPF